jgi:hypothetical protein
MSKRYVVTVILLMIVVAVPDCGEAVTTTATFVPVPLRSATLAVADMTPPESVDKNVSDPDTVVNDAPQGEPENQNVPTESAVVSTDGGLPRSDETAAAVTPAEKAAGVRSTAALKSIQSVLEQFRTYKDVRTIARLSTLFDRKLLSAAGINQTPEIVVTDGNTLVTISIELANKVDTPSFSLKGANMKSIRQLSDTKWELDALPQVDKTDVRLSIILGGERTEVTLVAVPAITQAGAALLALPDAALDELLTKPLTDNKPLYDVNADGIQDYLDDYILVAHWLLKQKSGVNKDDVLHTLPAKDGSSK